MADQLNMNGLSLNDQHGGRSAYIPPHMRGMPPPSMEGPPPPMNGHMNGNAWGGGPTKYGQSLIPAGIAHLLTEIFVQRRKKRCTRPTKLGQCSKLHPTEQ